MTIDRVVLRGDGTEAVVIPSLGNVCAAFRVRGWSVLDEAPDDTALLATPSRWGIPILFPWPNRVAHGRFVFDGETVTVPTKGEHANHGFVRDRPWTLVERGDDRVRSRIALDHPSFPCTLEVEHRLVGDALRISAEATNTGASAMPMGYGLHPYFALPPGDRGRCTVRIPARSGWELEGFLPTGRVLPRIDLREPRALGDDAYDDVLGDLDRPFAATLHDPVNDRTVVVRSDAAFREHVLYAPLDRPVVCLEPYTCPTDAFNLEARGIPAGVVRLAPGASWKGVVTIEARTG